MLTDAIIRKSGMAVSSNIKERDRLKLTLQAVIQVHGT